MRAAVFAIVLAACAPKLAPLSPGATAKAAPAITGVDLEGNEVRLADLSGKVVLVNHFGTWCGPCLRETPHLVRMHAELSERGFEIYAIDHNDTRLAARNFASEHGVRFPIVFLPAGQNPFHVRALPTNVLVDKHGRVRLRSKGFRPGVIEGLRTAVEALLEEP